MVPFDQLVPTVRIVILQNTFNYSRVGFYNPSTKPVRTDITYADKAAKGFSMKYAVDFLTNGLEGMVTVYDPEGKTKEVAAADFAGMYAILEFDSDAAPILYNPATKTEIPAFAYAVTTGGEAIYSVVSGSTHNCVEIVEKVGWDKNATYRYIASDFFYFPVPPAENAVGEIRGAFSGAINGSFPTLDIASGKINDVIYIEPVVEAAAK